jgi:hypothetical protein
MMYKKARFIESVGLLFDFVALTSTQDFMFLYFIMFGFRSIITTLSALVIYDMRTNTSSFWFILSFINIIFSLNYAIPYLRIPHLFKQANNAQPYDCCICLESVSPGEGVSPTACEHVFHEPCLSDWLVTV